MYLSAGNCRLFFVPAILFPQRRLFSLSPQCADMTRGLLTITLLVISNVFMTIAWYGHLRLKQTDRFSQLSLVAIILISWGVALLEYAFQVPANRIGYKDNGGPFNLWQLKVIQEVITLVVFTGFTLAFFKNEVFRINHLIGFMFLVLAVYFIFRK
jgi:uncharacterized protein (DUF486 family)